MTHIEFYDHATGKYIKQWPNWTGALPAIGDEITLHYGDTCEKTEKYSVWRREIDGTRPDYIILFVEKYRK